MRERRAAGILSRGAIIGLIGIAFVFNFAGAGTSAEEQQAATKAATSAAAEWLTLVDDGKYNDGWDVASPLLQNAVTKEQFARSLAGARQPLGKLVSRELKSARYKTSLPGAPDGQYVVIQYAASFVNKKSAIETITPKLDTGGKWRVSGYYIK
jgi:hypothetical protein